MMLKRMLVTLLVVFSILFLIVTIHALVLNLSNLRSLEDLSNFGQYLGGTSGILISLIVAIAALLAYSEQRKQIQLFEHANHKQSVENTFFQLLKYHEEIVKNMDVSEISPNKPPHHFQGRNAFKALYSMFNDYYFKETMVVSIRNDLTEPVTDAKKQKIKNVINKAYIEFDKDYQPHLGFYFRNMYYIITLIDRDKILNDPEKNFYIKMLRAHLSTFEILLLFYVSLSERGNLKAKPLLEKYHLLKHVETFKDKLLDRENCDHMYLYNPAAYSK